MKGISFEEFWSRMAESLSSEQTIINWTNDKGPTGESFTAGPVGVDYVIVRLPSAINKLRVPKADFKLTFDNWQKYMDRLVCRSELMQQSRFTKYTISIIHQVKADF